MKSKLFLTAAFLIITISSFSQNTTWEKWTPLLGAWEGTGAGQPGQGAGTFTFSYDLDRKIITRKSHSEYPAAENKPKIAHDDLMVIYIDGSTNFPKAIYFDNEGHTITYNIVYKDNSIVLTGEKILNAPIFRLTYTLLSKSEMNTKFEMSPDGQRYTPYIEGKCTKIR
jgi:hypothetical protein